MEIINLPTINQERLGAKLKYLREHDDNLRRYVCFVTEKNGNCDNEKQCETCDARIDMDNFISRQELSRALHVSQDQLVNYESGRSAVPVEILLWYCKVCGEDFYKLLDIENY